MTRDSAIRATDRHPTILILAYSDLSRDPRVARQIRWLSGDYHVIAAGYAPMNDAAATFIDITPEAAASRYFLALRSAIARIPFARTTYRALKNLLIKLKQSGAPQIQSPPQSEKYVQYYRNKLDGYTNYSVIEGLKPDLIIANDLDCLVLAHDVFGNIKIIFDAHEYAPLEFGKGHGWLNLEQPARIHFCAELLPKIARMTTVCQRIADEYMSQFSLQSPVEVVTNSPSYENITPSRTGGKIRIVHHGLAAPIRKIELMAEAVRLLDDRFELFLMLVEGSAKYINQLKMRYGEEPRIHFLNPVPMAEIARFTSQFDIGMFILEPEIFNYKYALPNKFFEFIQARLAIAIGPSPEMARMVKEHDLGVVAADFSPAAMAESLRGLSISDIDRFKSNSHRAAAEFCAETNRDKMLNIVRSVLSDSGLPKPADNPGN